MRCENCGGTLEVNGICHTDNFFVRRRKCKKCNKVIYTAEVNLYSAEKIYKDIINEKNRKRRKARREKILNEIKKAKSDYESGKKNIEDIAEEFEIDIKKAAMVIKENAETAIKIIGSSGAGTSICWKCENAVPKKDDLGRYKKGCSWSVAGVPIEGWQAEYNRSTRGYRVECCPKFKEE